MARLPRCAGADQPDYLVPLADLIDNDIADPVAIAVEFDMRELAEMVASYAATPIGQSQLLDADDVLFDPPTPTCTKICCLALNYREHAAESNLELPDAPVLFLKPPSALVGHRQIVDAPGRTSHLEHEVELAVIIAATTRDLPASRWREAVAGFTIVNDMTARDLQLVNMKRNVPWDQSKAFDTFAPVGPYLVTPDELSDPHALMMTLSVGGEVRQSANTSQMVFRIPELIADLSDGMTLLPGDIIATGTTAGIAPLADGDVMRATIACLGTLENPVRYRSTLARSRQS